MIDAINCYRKDLTVRGASDRGSRRTRSIIILLACVFSLLFLSACLRSKDPIYSKSLSNQFPKDFALVEIDGQGKRKIQKNSPKYYRFKWNNSLEKYEGLVKHPQVGLGEVSYTRFSFVLRGTGRCCFVQAEAYKSENSDSVKLFDYLPLRRKDGNVYIWRVSLDARDHLEIFDMSLNVESRDELNSVHSELAKSKLYLAPSVFRLFDMKTDRRALAEFVR